MKKIKLAFIGSGFMAQSAHLPSFYADPRVEIVALSDLDEKLLDQVSKNDINIIKMSIKLLFNRHF